MTLHASDRLMTMVPDDPEEAPGKSFEQFFRDSWPAAVRLATFLAQDRGVGEEIAQDALTQLYGAWGRADEPGAYLRKTIVNRCHNWRRHAKVRDNKLHLLAGPESAGLQFDDLADAVARLPFRQRAVVVLRYHAGLSEAEIADALGCRAGTVKSLSSRALARLEKEIDR